MDREPFPKDRRPAILGVAGLLLLGTLWLASGSCDGSLASSGSGRNRADAELAGLDGNARLHRVTLGGRGAEEHVVPTRIEAAPGDGVEFRTVDHRVHVVTFPSDSLTPAVQDFLTSTGQRVSPPLVARGSRFLLRLEGAPHGRYPFVAEGHGGRAYGVIEVREEGDGAPSP